MVATVGVIGALAAVTIFTGGAGGVVVPVVGNALVTTVIPSAVSTSIAVGGGAAAAATVAASAAGTAAVAGVASAGAAGGIAAAAGTAGAAATAGTSSALATLGGVAAASGPIGWIVAGAAEEESIVAPYSEKPQYTFECWKQLVHDTTVEPSKGRTLYDLSLDPRVTGISFVNDPQICYLIIENKWNEKYIANFVELYDGEFALHIDQKNFYKAK